MNEQRPKPVFGMKNELHTQLQFIRWAIEEAQEAANEAQAKAKLAADAVNALLDEDGPVFEKVRCLSCRTSWMDQRDCPTVTHCPMCGKKAAV